MAFVPAHRPLMQALAAVPHRRLRRRVRRRHEPVQRHTGVEDDLADCFHLCCGCDAAH
jgi:hypothetical protein